jgi:hypothetical protein
VALFKKMQWKRVCLIASDEVYGKSLASWLDSASLTTGAFSMSTSLFTAVANTTITQWSAYASFQILLNANCRVFILHTLIAYAQTALLAAKSLSILDNPKVR